MEKEGGDLMVFPRGFKISQLWLSSLHPNILGKGEKNHPECWLSGAEKAAFLLAIGRIYLDKLLEENSSGYWYFLLRWQEGGYSDL